MLIYTYQKSKKRKVPKKQAESYQNWLDNLPTTNFSRGTPKPKNVQAYVPPKPFVRETVKHPSLNSFSGSCTKPVHSKVYTGTKMLGIGTLHKSNAVPIFTEDDAKDQATMRR